MKDTRYSSLLTFLPNGQDVQEAVNLSWADKFHNYAGFYANTEEFEMADTLYQFALLIRRRCLGEHHRDVALTLHSIGDLYEEQGKFADAEPYYLGAITIWEQNPDQNCAFLGIAHRWYARLLRRLERIEESKHEEQLAERVLEGCAMR